MYADYSKLFQLQTEESEKGLGAVLYQKQDDGTMKVIAMVADLSPKLRKTMMLIN